ncbi:ABC transporter substrate-binding protein [Herbiconiux sp.]|uniref:ABC transporter substrate-binding protein n=1 Tax=Herbiconiux sp. TaxID=1871186 RepID=UPI0025C5C55D|nr:ABC transporter substrate-binding protein [Herbiconiux sp.]
MTSASRSLARSRFRSRSRARRFVPVFALTAAAALVLAGCSGASGDPATTGSGSGDGASKGAAADPRAPEQTDVAVGGIRAPGLAPLSLAQSAGIAADYGLEWTPSWVDNSGIAVTSVLSGDLVAANSSYFGVIDAALQGLDIVVVTEGWASAPGTGSLETMPDSGIESVEDLIGKTVAVVSLNSSHAIKLKDQLLKADLDPDDVNWVELPYGEVATALEQGTVDASSAVGAALAAAKNDLGTVTVFDYGSGEYEGMAESGYIMKRSFVEANPNTTAAIQCTLAESAQLALDDEETYLGELTAVFGMTPEAAKADVPPAFISGSRADALQKNADIYLNVGSIEGEFDMSSITIPMPENC